MPSLEERAYLAAAGGRAGEATLRDLLRGGADFSRVVEMAVADGVAGPFARLMRGVGGIVLAPDTAGRLRDLERAPEFRMRFLEQRLGAALRTLDGAGFDVLVVGGAALGFTSYESFADMVIDEAGLLVRSHVRGIVEAVEVRLSDNGWRTGERARVFVDTKAPALGVKLEVARELFHGRRHQFALSAADVWARAEHRASLPPRSRVPGRVDRLLLACIDFSWGRGLKQGRWRGLRDVAAIVAEGPFEWPEFVVRAEQTKSADHCYATLHLARECADQPVPDEVLARLRPPWWRRLLPF